MSDNKNPAEKQPGEKEPGKFHYNPGNQSGKSAEKTLTKPESELENNRDRSGDRKRRAPEIAISDQPSFAVADAGGVSLFLVDAKAAGVALRPVQMIDDRGAAEITLTNLQVPASALLGPLDGALPLIERAYDRGAAAVCCEAVGAMVAANETTLEYLKTRVQFGRPIGKFQALQHRMADMAMAEELARSMSFLVASAADEADPAGTGACNLRLQGADRRGRTHRGPWRRPAAWRDRHDHGICDRPLPPAHRRRREAVRRRRSSPRPVCGQFVGVTSRISISVHLIDPKTRRYQCNSCRTTPSPIASQKFVL